MLDEAVNQIIERKIIEEKKERMDSGWQPIPLHDELEIPPVVPREEEPTEKPVKIDIWGPQEDSAIVNDNILNFYSPRKYF